MAAIALVQEWVQKSVEETIGNAKSVNVKTSFKFVCFCATSYFVLKRLDKYLKVSQVSVLIYSSVWHRNIKNFAETVKITWKTQSLSCKNN